MDGHIDHIALDVLDINAAFQELQAASMEILEKAPVPLDFWDKGIQYFNIRGPDREKIEFSEKIK